MKGKFITLEGIEGSGKSTSIKDIANTLDQKLIDYVVTKEPGSGPLGKDLRSLLLSNENKISGEVELLLMMADRKNHLDSLVIPNLNNGNWVLSDRYLDSTYAYQGGGRNMDFALIDELSKSLNLPVPDLTILFDLPVEIALERAKKRANLDRFEKEPIDFHNRIRNVYKSRAVEDPKRIKIVDSSVSFQEVTDQVVYVVSQFLNEK
tara:strand:- start:424 stop:1044 length:621 start_codon:yes stop_codon:yes gene_type:complete